MDPSYSNVTGNYLLKQWCNDYQKLNLLSVCMLLTLASVFFVLLLFFFKIISETTLLWNFFGFIADVD